MKKLIAIICAVVLVATSVFGAIVFTAAAVNTAINSNVADTVTLPLWENEFGEEIQLFPNSEKDLSKYVSTYDNIGFVENTSVMPFTTLLSIHANDDKANYNPSIDFPQTVTMDTAEGIMFYVEIPEFGSVTHTYDNGNTYTTDKFRFALNFGGYDYLRDTEDADGDGDTTEYLYNDDGSIQKKQKTYYRYGTPDWYIRAVGDTEWKTSGTKNYYGVLLESGWKGYVLVPFNRIEQKNYNMTEDSNITHVYITQLNGKNRTDVFYSNTNSGVYYGYATEEKPLVVSEPMFINGSLAGGCEEFIKDSGVTIKGVEYNYNTGKAVVSTGYPAGLGFASANASSVSAVSNTTAVTISEISSNTPLISNSAYSIPLATNKLNNWNNFAVEYSFAANTACPDGFLVYIELPKWNKDHQIYPQMNVQGTNGICMEGGANGKTYTYYYLSSGSESWTAKNVLTSAEATAQYGNANVKYNIVLPDAFSGYLYIPAAAFRTNFTAKTLTKLQLGIRNHDGDSGSAKVSQLMLVTDFDETSTFMYGDNCLADISTGEKIGKNDYTSAKEFNGKESLINNGSANVLGLNTVKLNAQPIAKVSAGKPNITTIKFASTDYNVKYVNSKCAISDMPNLSVNGTVDNTFTYYISHDFQNVAASDIDGFMFYIKVGAEPVSFGFGAGATATTLDDKSGTCYTYYGYTNTLPLLSKTGDWTNSTAKTPVSGVSQIPANFEGYVYLPKFGAMTGTSASVYLDGAWTKSEIDCEKTQIWQLSMYVTSATAEKPNISYEIGPIMAVEKGTYTQENAGKAFVNGSNVAQDMFTGNFVVPNDYDKDMRIDLLDLVQAQTEANEIDFTAFRSNYLNDYLKDADDTVVSAAFSLMPMVYTDADVNTILSDNPDRGYRSEMNLYIKAGTADPLYLDKWYMADQPDGERVNMLSFETKAAAQSWIDEQVANESTFDLIYYQNDSSEVDTGTIEPEHTYIIDRKTFTAGNNKGKTLYYVYRAFETEEMARAFCYGSKIFKGDNGYVTQYVSVTEESTNQNGGTVLTEKPCYRVRYDWRSVFTGAPEADQITVIDRYIRTAFDDVKEYPTGVDASNLALTYLYITDWNGTTSSSDTTTVEDLPEAALSSIELFFERMSVYNKKAEVRFCYNGNISRSWKYSGVAGSIGSSQPYNDDWLASNCANEPTMLRHIDQLAPIVAEYKDTIHNISNGFIGYVGEMVDGFQYPRVSYAKVQKAIVEKLCVPNGLFFSTRSPSYKEMIRAEYPNWAYFDYVAHNNDAMYGEQTHSEWNSGGFQKGNPEGTTTDWWEYVTINAYKTPQGGEMYVQGSMIPYGKIPTGLEMILELAHHRHTSFSYWHGYLEGDYTKGEYEVKSIFKDVWMEEAVTPEILEAAGIAYDPAWFNGDEERNAYEFIRDHLGYRLVAQKASVEYNEGISDTMYIDVSLKNYGFAAAFNMSAEVVLLNSSYNKVGSYDDISPETWYNLPASYYTTDRKSSAQGDVMTHTINAKIKAPKTNGRYYIAFKMQNTAGETARLANDVEYVNGYNILGYIDYIA